VTQSLLVQSTNIRKAVQQLAKQEKVADTVKGLSDLRNQFAELVEELEAVNGLVTGGSAAGFTPKLEAQADDILQSLTALGESSNQGLLDGPQTQKVIDAVRSAANTTRTAYALHWRDHVISRVPNLDGLEELASVFTQVGGDRAAIANLKSAVVQLRELVNSAPTAKSLSVLDDIARDVPEALKHLVGENSQVRAFAEDIARGGASVDSLTGPVHAWMKERGFDQSFKIVPGRPSR
jgi:hypothetical protein